MIRPVLALALVAVLLPGCGYALGPLVREEMRVVAVPVFRNDTRERELEYPLTQAVIRELRSRGFVVRTWGGKTTTLAGRIVKVEQAVTSEDPLDLSDAGTVRVTVEVALLATRGREIARFQVSETGEFSSHRNETRFTARQTAMAELALAVVRRLESLRF